MSPLAVVALVVSLPAIVCGMYMVIMTNTTTTILIP